MATQIQWTWPSTHGEDSFVIMFGGLHIEMAVLKVNTTYGLFRVRIGVIATSRDVLRHKHFRTAQPCVPFALRPFEI